MRARTLNGPKLKVNDRRGNPVEIATVVVWRVSDTAQAVFDVDDFELYVETQSETALRHLASSYAYDHGEENEITLRSNVDEVSQALKDELEQRLARAGVVVEEARLTHLAYAPEIAQAMLRRQQAEAIIDARQKIVHGAVSMVDMALRELAEKNVVELDSGTQGGHDQQPDGGAVRRVRGASGGERRYPLRISIADGDASSSCSASTPASGRTWRPGPRTSCAVSTGRSSTCCARRSGSARAARANRRPTRDPRKDGHERPTAGDAGRVICSTTPWPSRPGEKVLIEGETGSRELMIALVEETYRRGAVPFVTLGDARLRRALAPRRPS